MRDYEIVYIFKSGFMPEEIEQKLEKYHGVLTGDGGEITAVEQWGKRQLAYPIRKETNGYYVIAQFTSQPDALPEFERRLKLDEDLLRHLIVISEGELPKPAATMEHGEPRGEAPPAKSPEEKPEPAEEATGDETESDEAESDEAESDEAEGDEAADVSGETEEEEVPPSESASEPEETEPDVVADEAAESEPSEEAPTDSGDEEKGS